MARRRFWVEQHQLINQHIKNITPALTLCVSFWSMNCGVIAKVANFSKRDSATLNYGSFLFITCGPEKALYISQKTKTLARLAILHENQ